MGLQLGAGGYFAECSSLQPAHAQPAAPAPAATPPPCRRQFPGGAVPGKPRAPDAAATDPCPACGYQLSSPEQTFCVTCGHYDPQLRSGSSGGGAGSG